MSKWRTIKAIRRASEIARQRARRRWELERARLDEVARSDPAFTSREITRRIVVIDHERVVREEVFYAGDSIRASRAKLRRILAMSNDQTHP